MSARRDDQTGAGQAEDDDLADVPVDGPQTIAEERLLASFSRQARSVNHARVVRLLELLDSADAGCLGEAGRREAQSLAHQVVGSAGTFGFPTASVDAVSIEEYFAADGAARARDAARVRSTLDRLRAQFAG